MNYEHGCSRYVSDMLARGHAQEEIESRLLQMGWHPDSARNALSQGASKPKRHHAIGPDLERFPNGLNVDGQAMSVLMRMRHPDMCLIGNAVSAEECERIKNAASSRLSPSKVFVRDSGRSGTTSYARTSEQADIPYGSLDFADRIYERCAAIVRWPVEKMEPMHVVRYMPGGDFGPHRDYFSVKTGGGKHRSQRLATLILYLNTPEAGGATSFLDVETEIFPQAGNLLYFSYHDASPETRTLHAGVPLACGEKWIATIFLIEPVQAIASEAIAS